MNWTSIFGQKQDPEFQDFSSLVTDMHSHLIPGLDDGSSSVEESLEMIRAMYDLGYRKLIITPHVMAGFHDNSTQAILSGLESLQFAVKQDGIDIELIAGAEYMVCDEFEEHLKTGDLLTFSDKHILLELSTFTPHPNFKAMLFDLNIAGYTVVIAHAERYNYWFNDLNVFDELKSGGALIQVNTLSFSGYYGKVCKKYAETLAEAGLIDLLGSDLHHPKSLPFFKEALQKRSLQVLLSSGKIRNKLL